MKNAKIKIGEDKLTVIYYDLECDCPGLIVFCKVPSCRRLAELAVDYSSPGSEPYREYYCSYCYNDKLVKEAEHNAYQELD
jgi:hypothetical protein